MPLIEGYILDISAVTYSNFVSKICHSMNKGANKKLPFLIFLKSNPRTLTHRPSLNLPRSQPGFKLLLGVSICMKQMSLKITAFTLKTNSSEGVFIAAAVDKLGKLTHQIRWLTSPLLLPGINKNIKQSFNRK